MGGKTRWRFTISTITYIVCRVSAASTQSNATSSVAGKPLGNSNGGDEEELENEIILSELILAVAACGLTVVAVVILIISIICCLRCHLERSKAEAKAVYMGYMCEEAPKPYNPVYSTERKLAQSAQMYHFEYQKQQIIEAERANSEAHDQESDAGSEAGGKEGDMAVFNFPGPAMDTGDIEIGNPNFNEENFVHSNTTDDEIDDDDVFEVESEVGSVTMSSGEYLVNPPMTAVDPVSKVDSPSSFNHEVGPPTTSDHPTPDHTVNPSTTVDPFTSDDLPMTDHAVDPSTTVDQSISDHIVDLSTAATLDDSTGSVVKVPKKKNGHANKLNQVD